tara:strand:- start:1544 stop:2488 length:945 start_codon:yes stop_codon:yes gene_type:complete
MANIIAEFCQNHNGDFVLLKEMVHAAKESGATHGKIQTIFSDDLTFRERFEEGKIINNKIVTLKRPYKAEYERLKKLDLSLENQLEFINICEKINLIPLTTVFTWDSIEKVYNIGFKNIKVASYDCSSFPFLKKLKKYFDKIILSTGATYDHEIDRAYNILNDHDFNFLHCVTIYPTPLNKMNLERINYLKKYSKSVGFSEHSLVKRDGIKASKVALWLGAEIIERHFTILGEEDSKDGPVSINQKLLEELSEFSKLDKESMYDIIVDEIPDYEIMLGNKKRSLSDEELRNRDYYRGRFASRDNKGEYRYNWEN